MIVAINHSSISKILPTSSISLVIFEESYEIATIIEYLFAQSLLHSQLILSHIIVAFFEVVEWPNLNTNVIIFHLLLVLLEFKLSDVMMDLVEVLYFDFDLMTASVECILW